MIYKELESSETVSFSLDVWKAPNGKYIFAIIVHWTTEGFEDRQIVLHFGHLKGSHTRENLAYETLAVLKRFNLEQKLVATTGDNASNNPTLCRQLYKLLSKDFTSDITLADRPYDPRELIQFKGNQSFVRCLAHILNLIAKAILKALNAGSHKDAKKLIYKMAEKRIEPFTDTPRSAIARLRLIVLWLLNHILVIQKPLIRLMHSVESYFFRKEYQQNHCRPGKAAHGGPYDPQRINIQSYQLIAQNVWWHDPNELGKRTSVRGPPTGV
jgi:hypothetical protein